MESIKWKSLVTTSLVCLLPVVLGVVLWDKLPGEMAIHFNLKNEPDNFASRTVGVLLLPFIMFLCQVICCVTIDIAAFKSKETVKGEKFAKWLLPILTIALQMATLGYNINNSMDIRRIISVIAGVFFFVTGIYLPKLDYVKNKKVDKETARKINKFTGDLTTILGALFVASVFFEPIATTVCLLLVIPYSIICVVYAFIVSRK